MFLHEVATLNMIYMVDVLNRIASVALTPVSHVTIAYGRYDRYYHKTVITMNNAHTCRHLACDNIQGTQRPSLLRGRFFTVMV